MKTLAKSSKIVSCLILSLLLSACFIRPYKFDLEQGNIITNEKVAQITPGMSEEQVRYVLGTPMLNDVFHTNRWDYVYYDKPRTGKETRQHIAVHFEDGRVVEVTRDFLSEAVA
ncbi:MAG: outer membrane protein assembly factor BamE [Gammaproteobacteria bacterium]|jgi:outer membrane protein assembly factor BamE|nr:outer membrane protein assembly factor BamE [Gammaproteobacteria bacterium]